MSARLSDEYLNYTRVFTINGFGRVSEGRTAIEPEKIKITFQMNDDGGVTWAATLTGYRVKANGEVGKLMYSIYFVEDGEDTPGWVKTLANRQTEIMAKLGLGKPQ